MSHAFSQSRVISPDLLARIADLDLVARIIVDGLVSGLHRSPFHGYSAEFSQYRHYRPGDDLKYVDWKLAARTGRVYTKQFRETTNMAAAFVLDTSASMAFPDAAASAGTRTTKFRYAVMAVAALAHVMASQGDAVGLVAADRGVASKTGRAHLRALLGMLATLKPGSQWQPAAVIRRAADRLGRKGLLIALSDFYDDEDRVFAELRRSSRMGHEVVMLQIMSREEIDFAYPADSEFVDLETGSMVAVDPRAVRREYTSEVAAFLERWRQRAGAEGFQHTLMITDVPIDRALRNLLLARAGLSPPA